MRNLNTLRTFIQVTETASFSLAADRLGLTASAVSKSISRLEDEIGTRLFQRSTRRVSLTNEGRAFYERTKNILLELEDAEAELASSAAEPRGRLRVQMPVGFGRKVVVPKLLDFCNDHPKLAVDVELSDRVVDVGYEGIDLAIQIGAVSDPRCIARQLCRLSFAAWASPDYLARHGEPRTPEDLSSHRCLAYWQPMSRSTREWLFERDGRTFSVPMSGTLNINNAETLLEAAVEGAGIVMVSDFIAAEAYRQGRLRRLLADYVTRGPEVFAVYSPRPSLSAKVGVFIEFLRETVKDIEALQIGRLASD